MQNVKTRSRKKSSLSPLRIYFDCETYNDYEHLKNLPHNKKLLKVDQLPIIVPYLIGACTDEPGSYVYFSGPRSTIDFVHGLYNISSGRKTTLYAFNVDYDFQAIKNFLIDCYPESKIDYRLTPNKKFICGSIRNSQLKIDIQIRDFWVGDKTKGLQDYYKNINYLASHDAEGQLLIEKYGVQNLEKLSIEDYCKKDLHEKDGHYYYGDEGDNLKELNVKQELAYLKMDVLGLPLVRQYIEQFKHICIRGLGLQYEIDGKKVRQAYSIPSFGKILVSQYLKTPMDDLYRPVVDMETYQKQDLSYFGGFTANNKDLLKVQDSRDKDGNPNIYSYDVNSMYPAIMHKGLPVGKIYWGIAPKSKHVTGLQIGFPREGAPGVLYEYKPEYNCLNNSFFGDGFFPLSVSSGFNSTKFYVEKSVFEMFKKMCNSYVEVVEEETKYQLLQRDLSPFIDVLYEKKNTANTKEEKQAFKLILNSLYGKMAERFHQDYYSWDSVTKLFQRVPNDREDRDTILAGLYITSRARVILFEAIKQEIDNGNIVLGVDTDSIKLIVNNPVKLDIHPTRLGAGKHEDTMTDFYHNNKKKKYYLYNRDTKEHKLATSGINALIIDKLSHEDKVTLFDPDNDCIFPQIKNVSQRNRYFQICISKANVRFNYQKDRDITHVYENGKIVKYEDSKQII